jgi:hypothetical protein
MPPSVNPLRLQVIDRIVTVLTAITTGSDYFFTPGKVAKRFMHESEISAYPCYMVSAGDQGGPIEMEGAPDAYEEIFYVSIKGVIKDSTDTVTKCEQALRDIRKAINTDSKLQTAGALGTLTDEVLAVQGPDMDDGYLSLQGFGFFDQKFRVRTHGDFGEL